MTVAATVDPASRTASSWSSTLAALKSRGVPDTDPRVLECQTALAYWRCRRVIDAERDNLNPAHIPALADMLRHPHAAAVSR
ncbi:hypothetical protein H5U98_15705 [Mycolicibacterium boenickei]|uniref:Uncharacterized protein n=1 Tax=Mycolicibacterium boenickei TaxID=146017 RepID=A0AAX3A6Z1_9MYCO|nr:hypothetical protein [Mycolicibacterium boenickei]PEG59526.1 hypothetical protein CQY21_16885 [Mycolicibacterium boenickei]UNC02681.1 hypothetical protein H5U98_15705 [Mycolicibacterium boenickei]BBX92723.1 hypothetical protein MBOE_43720 [Mycolicibacterium boenickei]